MTPAQEARLYEIRVWFWTAALLGLILVVGLDAVRAQAPGLREMLPPHSRPPCTLHWGEDNGRVKAIGYKIFADMGNGKVPDIQTLPASQRFWIVPPQTVRVMLQALGPAGDSQWTSFVVPTGCP